MILKNWNYILFLISIISLSFALIAEHYFKIQPCDLCLKQRHPYYIFLIIFFILLFTSNFYKIWLFILVQFVTLYGLFYSIWHVGIENKLLKAPSVCSTGLLQSSNVADLKEQILAKKIIPCDEVIWSFFGISAATINSMVLLFIFLINAIYILKLYGEKK